MIPENETPSILPERHAGEGMFDPQLALPLPAETAPAPFQTVVKRDGREEIFDRRKIAEGIQRAMDTLAMTDPGLAESLASAVAIYLPKVMGSQPPTVDQIHDAVERVLIHMGHARVALTYARYRDRRARIRRLREGDLRAVLNEIEEARREQDVPGALDRALFQVRTTGDRIAAWDRDRIIGALEREAGIDRNMATLIAAEVEDQLARASIHNLTSSLVRELVSARLIEHGLLEERERHRRLGVPVYDATRLIKGLSSTLQASDPDSTDRALARAMKKEYALSEVFSPMVAEAHLSGDLYIHHLDQVDRLYAASPDLSRIAQYGVRLPDGRSFAAAPRYPDTLLAQWMKWDRRLGALFAEQLNWRAVNVLAAPFLADLDEDAIRQFAQMLVYEFAYRALSGESPAGPESRLEICWTVPEAWKSAEAVGPGGKPTGRTYGGHGHDAQRLAWAIVDILCEGGEEGLAFPAPVILFPIDTAFFADPAAEAFLRQTGRLAAIEGHFEYRFDRRENASVESSCWQRVTLNLPRAAFDGGSEEAFMDRIDRLVSLAVQAHEEKQQFIEALLVADRRGPLAALSESVLGPIDTTQRTPFFAIAFDGLQEAVDAVMGFQSRDAGDKAALAQRIVARINTACREASRRRQIALAACADSSEETARRFAERDIEQRPKSVADVLRSPAGAPPISYSRGASFVQPGQTPFEIVRQEGAFHALLDGDAVSMAQLPEAGALEGSVADFVRKVWASTECHSLRFHR